jgi:prevent-host-death family protein
MNANEIGLFEAKTHLSKLLDQVAHGSNFIITRRGTPIAELRPIQSTKRSLSFGCDKDLITISDDFDDPIPGMEDYC